MPEAIQIAPNVRWVGMNDRTTDLFEGLWPISREGVTYNAYLVDGGERKALIDLAKGFKTDELLRNLEPFGGPAALDYVVVNHMEPDHTGALATIFGLAPKATVLCTEKARAMLASFYGIRDRVRAVKDGETVSLGRTNLQFFEAPFLHWPETMVTYEPESKALFPCDAFGSFGAFSGSIFDDGQDSLEFFEREALRYYANIVAKYSRMVLKAVEKLALLPVKIVAPSHGLIWRRDPARIIGLYKAWASYALPGEGGNVPGEPRVTVVYGSMYGNTAACAGAIAKGARAAGVPVETFDASRTHASYILPALWRSRGIAVGSPAYDGHLFPAVASVLSLAAQKGIVGRKAAFCGSYAWNGGAEAEFKREAEAMKWDLLGSLAFPGAPSPETLAAGEAMGAALARAIA